MHSAFARRDTKEAPQSRTSRSADIGTRKSHGGPAAIALALVMIGPCMAADPPALPVTLDVIFKLTDFDYKPISNAAVRVVFESEKDWQSPGARSSRTPRARRVSPRR
jgi:hypothetical protein